MEYPKPEATLEEQIAHWDTQRTLAIDGLVYATQQRIRVSRELNALPEFGSSIASMEPIPDNSVAYTDDPAYQESFVK